MGVLRKLMDDDCTLTGTVGERDGRGEESHVSRVTPKDLDDG